MNSFEQKFKSIDNILHKDAGSATALDYIEQSSWILFLKYIDELEEKKSMEAQLHGKEYSPLIEDKFAWDTWAAPKNEKGEIDHNKTHTGDDLINFVNDDLFPYLKSFKNKTDNPNTIEYKIGEIFGELKNKVQSGYTLRDVLDVIDDMSFKTQDQKHELSALYENRIAQMGNAGRNGGEYYTPRPLIQTMIKAVKPQLGETIYDGACGSAGFLVESFDYLKKNNELTAKDFKILQENTFYGKELKSLAYIIAVMNMILHGIEAPNIEHTNTLQENILNYSEKDKVDIVLANPPFGGSMRAEIKEQFPIKTGETAYLFMQHFMKKLKTGGRAAIVIKNTFLSNSDSASVALRKELLSKFNLDTVLDLPGGVFQGAGVKTIVLFFRKGEPTRDIWYYQLNLTRNIGKGSPLSETDMADFLTLHGGKKDSDNSWSISMDDIDQENFDLSVKNPNKNDEVILRSVDEILSEIEELDGKSRDVIKGIKNLI